MQIIELKITLEYVEPAVTRTLQVPANIRLDRLHLTIQAAMGWTNSHLYMFEAGGAPGYEEFLEATGDPKHPEHADLKSWYGGDFDPNIPHSDELRLEVLKLAKRWKPNGKRLN